MAPNLVHAKQSDAHCFVIKQFQVVIHINITEKQKGLSQPITLP